MTHTNHTQTFGACKHIAWVAFAFSLAGCVSGGSNPTTSTATSSSPTATSHQTSSPLSSSTTTSTSSSTSASPTSPTQSPGGATLIFSYPNGFASGTSALQLAASARFIGSVAALSSPSLGGHQAGAMWYKTPQNIKAFTTDFTFQIDPSAYGITFCVQNTNSTNNPYAFGDNASADANMLGYGAYNLANQYPLLDSVAIKFDLTPANGQAYLGATPNGTGLYINGGPYGETGFLPENDLNSSGFNLHSGDIMDAHVVYNGSVLTLTLRDTQTNARARMSWPIDIPAVTGSDYAWVGFTAGTIPAASQNILTWSYWQNYNHQLTAPTFSTAPGQYSSSQTVQIVAPSSETIYYTTNGQTPTRSSNQYTGPITVSSTTLVQAVAIETDYTDSPIASAYYQIAPNGTPTIDFPSTTGFSGASNLITVTGATEINGSDLQLTDTAHYLETGAAWFTSPVNVQNFTTHFTVDLTGPANANGFTFTIQNKDPTSADTSTRVVSGGPTAVSIDANGLGYQGIGSSVAIIFDLYDGSGDLTGLYTDGATPSGSSIDMSSSGLNLHSGNPLAVTIAYNGATLTMTITDTKTHASFSKTWTIDIPSIVGGNAAYVGFTGATGGLTALQDIASWTYTNN